MKSVCSSLAFSLFCSASFLAILLLTGCGLPLHVVPNLTFTPIPDQIMTAKTISVVAESESTGAVTYSVVSGPAVVTGNVVTLQQAGDVVISATQAATNNYAAASTTVSFSVKLAPSSLQIGAVGDRDWSSGSFPLSSQSSRSGPVTYSITSGPAKLNGNLVTLTGAGPVTVTATQAETSIYSGATAHVSFSSLPAKPSLTLSTTWTESGTIALSSSSTSSSPVTYSISSGAGTLSGNILTVNQSGALIISAAQPATSDYVQASATTTVAVKAAALNASPLSISFPDTKPGTASQPQFITVTNTGDLSASIDSVTTSSGFMLSNTCGTSLPAHYTCKFAVTFAPSQNGMITGTLTAKGGSALMIPLHGSATAQPTSSPTTPASSPSDPAQTGPPTTVLSSASVASLEAGTATTVHLFGSNLDSLIAVLTAGTSIPLTHNSSTDVSISITPPAYASGTILVAGVTSATTTNALAIPVVDKPVSYDAAVRFAQQATMAVTPAVIQDIQTQGFSQWIDTQISNPRAPYENYIDMQYGQYMRNTQDPTLALRTRVTLALKFIYTFGASDQCFISQCGHYWEARLQKDAFGNERDLLTDITLSPLMGNFLNNARNFVGYPWTGSQRPNQNYARELMQLMTIGPVRLNHDGSNYLDASGNTVNNYDENNVNDMAEAMSGLYMTGLGQYAKVTDGNPLTPMSAWEDAHVPLAKNPLPGLSLPAHQPTMTDISNVLDALFNHPSIGPFVCRRLIQHLVTSNPSPAYISRVTDVFEDNGKGVRGDLAAVIKAILLDNEARRGDDPATAVDTDSHMMEPLLYVANTMAAVGGVFTDDRVYQITGPLGQDLFMSQNVFGPIAPDFRVPTGEFAPETQLVNGSSYFVKLAFIKAMVTTGLGGLASNLSGSPFWNAPDSTTLLEQMRHFLFHGRTPKPVNDALVAYVADHNNAQPNDLIGPLCLIALTSSAYQVLR